MLGARLKCSSRWVGLAAVLALAVSAVPAMAATPAQPTAETITPAWRDTMSRVQQPAEGESIELAQARRDDRRRERGDRRNGRRDNRYDRRRDHRRPPRVDRRVDRRSARRGPPPRRVRHNGRYYYYNNGGWYDNTGAALAAGVIGLAAGAVLGGALADSGNSQVVVGAVPAPYTAEWYRRCDLKYRSFRASDGTYLGYDGVRHTCRLP